MALPFLNGNSKGRDQSLSIDLGGRTTKAVHLQRKGDDYVLARYAFVDAPIFEKNLTPELLSEHLKNVTQAMELKARPVTLAVGVNDSIVRQTEMPLMPVEDMRLILKNNTKIYLQQELPGYIFDCHIIPPRMPAKPPEKGQGGTNIPKSKVLAAGAKLQYLQDLQTAIKGAGLMADT